MFSGTIDVVRSIEPKRAPRKPGLPDGLDIFQLFVTTKPRGTGLGLSLAQQIIAEHGGTIAARNDPNGGAEFQVSLPLALAETPRKGTGS